MAKSQAGRRTVAFPKEIAVELRWHMECFAQPGSNGLVFIGPRQATAVDLPPKLDQGPQRGGPARTAFPRPAAHGQHEAAGQGASLRELMERMGHSSMRAALIYQHATRERDEPIAAGMGKLLRQARKAKGAGG